MSITTVNIDEAGSRINELVKLAHQGQEVVITDEGRPTARIVSVPPTTANVSSANIAARSRSPKTSMRRCLTNSG